MKEPGDGSTVHSQDDPKRRVGVNHDSDGIEIYVGHELKLRLTWEQKRTLELLLYYAVDPAMFDDRDNMEAQAEPLATDAESRGKASADQIFKETGLDEHLDEPEMQEAYDAVQQWFTTNDEAIQAAEHGEDDGCPCESCRDCHGPLTDHR